MKALVFFLIASIATFGVAEDWTPTEPCIQYDCEIGIDDVPVCGKYKKDGCYEEVIFPNQCFYLSANSCGKSMTVAHSYGGTKAPCIFYKCSSVWDPVCGKQMVNGCMEEKIFTNACQMASANSCGKANYVPCVENKCEKPV